MSAKKAVASLGNEREKDCDTFIQLAEKQITEMKALRVGLAKRAFSACDYERKMLQSLEAMQTSISGIRHNFIPIPIPSTLQVPREVPSWVSVSSADRAKIVEIAERNDGEQKELIVRFRSALHRTSSVEGVAVALAKRQEAVRDQNEWLCTSIVGNAFVAPMRESVPVVDTIDNGLLEILRKAYDHSAAAPFDMYSAEMFLMLVFGDDGELPNGFRCKTVTEEVGMIAACLAAIGHCLSPSQWIEAVKPYVADLRTNEVLKQLMPSVSAIQRAIKDLNELMGHVSMEDFGSTGESNPAVKGRLKECMVLEDGVDNLSGLLQHAADIAATADKGLMKDAARMIAVITINKNMTWLPLHFVYAAAWSGQTSRGMFTLSSVYVQAFDLIMRLHTDSGL